MADEAFVDEQNDEVDVLDEVVTEDGSEESDEVTNYAEQLEAKQAQIEADRKEIERLAKYEARYKANKKAEATKPKAEVSSNVNITDIVANEVAKIQEQSTFKTTYGDEIFNDVIAIQKQHPSLTLDQAMKLSPIANDPARAISSDATASAGRANLNNYNKTTYITTEAYSKLPLNEFSIVREKISKGEMTIKD